MIVYLNRLSDLLFVMARAVNHRAGRRDRMVDLQAAYDACARDCRAHYENFPVASMLLPRRMRPHVAALYAFARAADDFADEGDRSADERHRLLDGWHARLLEAVAGATSTIQRAPESGEPDHTREIFLALGATIRRLQLPPALLEDLLSAFRQDVTVTRYATWPALFDYCRRSANPVGRLVLRIAGYDDSELDEWSDAICTALQLTNFWQDLKSDCDRGRIYLPREEMQAHGARGDRARGDNLTRLARGARVRRQQNAGAVRGRPAAVRSAPRPAALRASRHVARRHADSRSTRGGELRRAAPSADPRRDRHSVARRDRPRMAEVRSVARSYDMSRDTSFYYSFLVLPPRKRSAIIAVWDFCRAVDDAVDEVVPESEWAGGLSAEARAKATAQLAIWRAELAACTTERRARRRARRFSRFIREFNLPRARFEELIDGVEMDLAHDALSTRSTALAEYCRRVASTVGLICVEIFGYRDPAARAYAVEPRNGAAVDEHHPRRRDRPRPRPDLSSGRGSRAVSA